MSEIVKDFACRPRMASGALTRDLYDNTLGKIRLQSLWQIEGCLQGRDIQPAEIIFPEVKIEYRTPDGATSPLAGLQEVPIVYISAPGQKVEKTVVNAALSSFLLGYQTDDWWSHRSIYRKTLSLNLNEMLLNCPTPIVLPAPSVNFGRIELDFSEDYIGDHFEAHRIVIPLGKVGKANEGFEDVLLLAGEEVEEGEKGAQTFIHVASLCLPARWREVVSDGRLVDRNSIPAYEDYDFSEGERALYSQILSQPDAAWKEIQQKVGKFPVSNALNKAREGIRSAVLDVGDGLLASVDVAAGENQQVKLRIHGLNVPELIKQIKDEQLRFYTLGECFRSPSFEEKMPDSLVMGVDLLNGPRGHLAIERWDVLTRKQEPSLRYFAADLKAADLTEEQFWGKLGLELAGVGAFAHIFSALHSKKTPVIKDPTDRFFHRPFSDYPQMSLGGRYF